ncbi:MAG: DNA primase [Dehalococcoidales bacterium]|nr:DNA primase [Dehalococcoidales bacterium]
MTVIDEVKQRTDIVEIIGQYTKLTKAGRTFRGLCPFHSEKHGSFFVYPEQQTWHCFGACNTGGDALTFVMKKEGMTFGEALRLLADKSGVTIPSRPGAEEDKEGRDELYKANEAAAQYFNNSLLNSSAAGKARKYVEGRGISAKTIADFQIGFSLDEWESLKKYLLERNYTEATLLTAGLIIQAENGKTHDRFRGRLMFPIRDARGRTMGFGGRALDDAVMPKYLNSPQTPIFDKSGSIYGIDLASASIRKQDQAIITEGYFDVIVPHQYGVTNVVASMGTSITEKQVSALKRLSRNLVLALDADAAGEEAMLRGVTYENRLDTEVKVIILPEGKDPDEVIKEDIKVWQGLVEKAMPIMDYAFNMATAKLDLTTARDKSTVLEKLLPVVAEIGNPVRQAHYLEKLAGLVKTSERSLESALSKIKMAGRPKAPDKKEAVARALKPITSSPLERDCLALLLKCTDLKCEELSPDYFQSSENREIFVTWQQVKDVSQLKERLDPTIHEHFDSLINKSFPSSQADERYASYLLRLRERFIKSTEARRAEVYALERESGGPGADLAKLEADGIEPSKQLKDIFARKGHTVKR